MIRALTIMEAFYSARRNFRSLRGETLRAYQDERAAEVVRHAISNAPFYAKHYSQHDPSAWRTLPTIDKHAMMSNFGEINTHALSLDEAMHVALTAERTRDFRPEVRGLTVGLSSGTSGHRSLFLADRTEQARWVGVVLARVLPPFRLRGYTVSLFSMSGSNLYNDLRGRWLRFHHHDLGTSIDDAVRMLNAEQPDLLCGPPSYLEALSARKLDGSLRVTPRKLISVAEVLEPHVAELLERRFGCGVHQIYQCTEGLIAISCPRGALHAQEDLVATQFVRLSPDDAVMTPIITDLWHRSLPIIRYRLGDAATLADDACECGSAFQVIRQVEGRCDDVCQFERADGTPRPVFPATFRRMMLLASNGIADYDVVQERPSHLRVRIAIRKNATASNVLSDVRAALVGGLEEQGVKNAELEVEIGACEKSSGKRRRVRRMKTPQTSAVEVR